MMLVLQALDLARPAPLWAVGALQVLSCRAARSTARVASIVEATTERVRHAFPDGEADDLDGLTVRYPDWWFNLRPSNTEPLLRLNVEAASEEEMAEHRDRILAVIRAS